MKELVRDTVVGRSLRIISGGKILPYLEQRDPSIWEKYAHKDKSANMAHHGSPSEEEKKETGGENSSHRRSGSHESAETVVADGTENINDVSGKKVDPEKGRDITVISWEGPNDPEV